MTTPRYLSNRYELGETLGFGGMSEVHLARDRRLNREVAIKVLRADLARDPSFYLRFRREAQNAASLNDSSIVAVYDTGEADTETGPLPYIVMEFVDGETLRDIVRAEGPMDPTRVLEVTAEVCTALQFSHEKNIVHRDVKPANIMISESGQVKVMDFGIARAIADGTSTMTQTAAVIGTAQYLSPEQARGESVDARSDVYSLGCVMYELLTGQPPFTGDSPVAVAYQHVKEDPIPPSQVRKGIPPELDAIVLKAISKNPANRYQSAAEMRADILRVLAGSRPNAPIIMTDEDRTTIIGIPAVGADGKPTEEAIPTEDRVGTWRGVLGVSLLALIAIAAVAVGVYFLFFKDDQQSLEIPTVARMSSADAQSRLQGLGFQVFATPKPDASVPEGAVIGTEPPSGTKVPSNSLVTVLVSSGPARVAVPDLSGLTLDEAKAKLDDVGLQAQDEVRRTESTAAEFDKVVNQNPSAGVSISVGTPVQITLGNGPEMVRVPNVTGQDVDIARANIEGLGFQVVIEPVDSEEPQGRVINTEPSGGTSAVSGSSVTIQVSNGTRTTMPDLRGLTPEEATARLRSAGWTGTLTPTPRPTLNPGEVGRIIAQQQPTGSEIGRTDPVAVEVGELGIPR
jgi:beta-lactam-binding protein with PASTA domain/predicted Ser/Thr protein kinase